MKKILIIAGLILMLLVPAACADSASKSEGIAPGIPEPMSPPTPAPAPRSGEDAVGGGGERIIIRTGNISLIVEDVSKTQDEIADLASELGGYVVSSRIYGQEQDLRGHIAIRVPDDDFSRALATLRALAVRVDSESTDSRDVTEEYVDLQARLKNAEATENQYLVLLEKADDVEDILSIYERLSQVRREIEQLKGQIQYLERTSSMSYIAVELRPEASAQPLVRAGWSIVETFKSAVRGLAVAGQVMGTIAIWLLIFIPIWGTALGIVIWRVRRKRRAGSS